jgi:hypothetical protein
MRKGLGAILLIATVAPSPFVAISTGCALQEVPPATTALGTVPDTRDILEKRESESLQSILWLHFGRSISKAEAKVLEAETRNNPTAIEPRLRLIGYYAWRGQGKADQMRLREHVLWMIENHPEHPATEEPALRDLPDDPEGNIRIRELWTANIERRSDDERVLRNAEKFFFGENPAEAEKIIRHLHDKDPSDHEWPGELVALYMTSGVPGLTAGTSGEIAMEAYRRVLNLTSESRSREILAENMADRYFKTGDFSSAAALARVSLQSPDGGIVRRANTLLGRIALRSGDVTGARQYLFESEKRKRTGNTSSVPFMGLAKELLEKDQREIVIKYLEDCVALWPQLRDVLQLWIADIKKGKIPDFGNAI